MHAALVDKLATAEQQGGKGNRKEDELSHRNPLFHQVLQGDFEVLRFHDLEVEQGTEDGERKEVQQESNLRR
jgi:hypothetical protein